jgi:hypothetical protein
VRRPRRPAGVGPRDDPLGGGLLVAGGAADLTGEVKARDRLSLQGVREDLGVDEIFARAIAWRSGGNEYSNEDSEAARDTCNHKTANDSPYSTS